MGLDALMNTLGDLASLAYQKTSEQMQTARLSFDKAGIERQIEGVYNAMGRYCHTRARRGESLPEELLEYCRDVEALEARLAEIEAEMELHRQKKNHAGPYAPSDDQGETVYAEVTAIEPIDDAPQNAPAGDGRQG